MTKTTYHHGDLRAALIDAAAQMMADKGVSALSLRAIARQVGVTHPAVYHHFANKGALFEAVAARGFALLDAAMAQAIESLPSDAYQARFQHLGRAYAAWAVANPSYFHVMFRARADQDRPAALEERAHRPFMRVLNVIEAILEQSDEPSPDDALTLTLLCWSSMHGLAALWLEGPRIAHVAGVADVDALAQRLSRLIFTILPPLR